MVQTIDRFADREDKLQGSIDEARLMLSDLYEGNEEAFKQCFEQYDQIMQSRVHVRASPISRPRSRNVRYSGSFSPPQGPSPLPHFCKDDKPMSPVVEELTS